MWRLTFLIFIRSGLKTIHIASYWYDNQWKKTTFRIEKIKIRGGATEMDTVFYTHQGPVVYLQKPKELLQVQ